MEDTGVMMEGPLQMGGILTNECHERQRLMIKIHAIRTVYYGEPALLLRHIRPPVIFKARIMHIEKVFFLII